MRMKTFFKTVMVLALALVSCQKEEVLPPDTPEPPVSEGDGSDTDGAEKVYLSISPSLSGMQELRGIIETFKQGDNIGVFAGEENRNVSFVYDGKVWQADPKIEVSGNMDVTAYYPFSKEVTSSESIPLSVDGQDDWLYGSGKASEVSPDVSLAMNHALTLVRIKVQRKDYSGEGLVSAVSFGGVHLQGTLNASTGEVVPAGTVGTYRTGGGFMLDDSNPVTVEAILLPVESALGENVTVNIDGKDFTYEFPDYHIWKAGMIYTYTLSMKGGYNTEVDMDDVLVDVEYWSTFGKTDEIVIMDKNDSNYNIDNWFTIRPNYTEYGNDMYRNEGKVFGLFYNYFGMTDFEGQLRFVFMQNGEIREQFQPIDIKVSAGAWDGKAVQCYVTSEPGTYQLVSLFRRKGETAWFRAYGYAGGTVKSCDEEWMYEVQPEAPADLPALRMMEVEGQGFVSILAYPVPDDAPWNLVYTLSNRSEVALKGEIKAVWEREFRMESNSYRPSTQKSGAVNDDQWADELGRVSVDIAPGVRFWKGIMECEFPVGRLNPMHNGVGYATPVVHLYWRAEGGSEWKLMRCDTDYLFNRDFEGDVWDETTNFLYIIPESWQ